MIQTNVASLSAYCVRACKIKHLTEREFSGIFFLGGGGEFCVFKTGIPGGPARNEICCFASEMSRTGTAEFRFSPLKLSDFSNFSAGWSWLSWSLMVMSFPTPSILFDETKKLIISCRLTGWQTLGSPSARIIINYGMYDPWLVKSKCKTRNRKRNVCYFCGPLILRERCSLPEVVIFC